MLDEITAVFVAKILFILDELDMSTIDFNCDFISEQMEGKNKDVFTLIQILIDSHCTLKEAVDTINEELDTAVSFDLKCVTATSPDVNGTIQGLINKVCSLDESVQDILDQLNNGTDISSTVNNLIGNYLHANVDTCSGYGITKAGSGETATLTLYGYVPPSCPIPCFAPLSYFDSTGVGLPDSLFCGWFICNGNNGTPDMRGYTFAGATALPGIFAANSLDTRVDPAVQGATFATATFDKKGEVQHVTTISEMPAHTHTITDPGHNHNNGAFDRILKFDGTGTVGPNDGDYVNDEPKLDDSVPMANSTTGITINSTGGGQAHNNVQPTIYGYWIVRGL